MFLHRLKTIIPTCLFLFAFSLNCFSISINNDKIRNIKAFDELYGYVRYFHPSDEAASIDWDAFAIYGLEQVYNAGSNDSLIMTLNKLFGPIAPSIIISKQSITRNVSSSIVPSGNLSNYKLICWQHIGVRADVNNDAYRSKRTNRTESKYVRTAVEDNLFESKIVIGECINKKIAEDIYCDVPICLYGDSIQTYPASNPEQLTYLKNKLSEVNKNDTTSTYARLASIIIIDNLIKHFYPYRPKLNDWQKIIDETLERFIDKKTTYMKHKEMLKLLSAKLNDGHSSIWSSLSKPPFFPPVNLLCINDTVVITGVFNDSLKKIISKGDIVLSIDGMNALSQVNDAMKITSGSKRYKKYLSVFNILKGTESSLIKLKVRTGKGIIELVLTRSFNYPEFIRKSANHPVLKEVDKRTLYIDFSRVSKRVMDSVILSKKQFHSIICDLREYPNIEQYFLSHLLKDKDTCGNWFRTPELERPNYDKETFQEEGWRLPSIEPILKANLLFLIDNKVISYGESFMSIVKHYKLGLMIGDTTAGTNGNLNMYKLPASLNFSWTGMKVRNLNGEPFDELGIAPDVFVPYTISGIRKGEDEILNKAIELSKIKR